jgi:hypothetical protein
MVPIKDANKIAIIIARTIAKFLLTVLLLLI